MSTESVITSATPPEKPQPGTAFENKAKEYKVRALTIAKISDNAVYKKAWELFRGGAAISKEISAFFGPIKADAHKAWQNNCQREEAILNPIEEGRNHLGKLITAYDAEQERLRLEEEAHQRKELAVSTDEQVLAEAEARAAEGDMEGALELIDQGGMMPAPVVGRTTPKPVGGHFRVTWSAALKGTTAQEQLASTIELIKAVAAGNAPLMAIEINWKYLNQRATSDKALLNIPGIVAKENRKPVART